jgi:hypothetical protein
MAAGSRPGSTWESRTRPGPVMMASSAGGLTSKGSQEHPKDHQSAYRPLLGLRTCRDLPGSTCRDYWRDFGLITSGLWHS